MKTLNSRASIGVGAAIAIVSLANQPTNALDLMVSCRMPHASIDTLLGVNSNKAVVIAHFKRSDIIHACSSGWTQNSSYKDCLKEFRSLIGSGVSATADCKDPKVTIKYDDGTIAVSGGSPFIKTCSTGGMSLAHSYQILCPKNADLHIKNCCD